MITRPSLKVLAQAHAHRRWMALPGPIGFPTHLLSLKIDGLLCKFFSSSFSIFKLFPSILGARRKEASLRGASTTAWRAPLDQFHCYSLLVYGSVSSHKAVYGAWSSLASFPTRRRQDVNIFHTEPGCSLNGKSGPSPGSFSGLVSSIFNQHVFVESIRREDVKELKRYTP